MVKTVGDIFSMQVRTEQFKDKRGKPKPAVQKHSSLVGDLKKASVFTAVVLHAKDGDKVQVELSKKNMVDVFINEELMDVSKEFLLRQPLKGIVTSCT